VHECSGAHLVQVRYIELMLSVRQITENYGNWVPPVDVREIVERLVMSVPERHLAGLGSIVLTTTTASNRSFRRRKVKHRGRKRSKLESNGSYQPAWPGHPAFIQLYVNNILAQYPRPASRISFIRELLLANTLFHEIGHHIQLTKAREFRQPEVVADEWADCLTRQYFGRRYWLVVLLTELIVRVLNHRTQRHVPESLGANSL
jgi:hypothetical protein